MVLLGLLSYALGEAGQPASPRDLFLPPQLLDSNVCCSAQLFAQVLRCWEYTSSPSASWLAPCRLISRAPEGFQHFLCLCLWPLASLLSSKNFTSNSLDPKILSLQRLKMGKCTDGRKTKPNIYSVLSTGGAGHLYINMSWENAACYSEGLGNWSTVEDWRHCLEDLMILKNDIFPTAFC